MSDVVHKLSHALPEIATVLDTLLRGATELERVPFVLLTAHATNVQYIANVARADGTQMIRNLLARWREPEGAVDLPPHQSDELIVRLQAQCRAYHAALDTAFAMLIEATRGVPAEPFMPSKSSMWSAMTAGKALMDEVEQAIAFSRELAKQGTMRPPPAGERH